MAPKYKPGTTRPFEDGSRLMEVEAISEKKPRNRSGKRFVTSRSKKTGQLKTRDASKQLTKSEKTVGLKKLKNIGKKIAKRSGPAGVAVGALDYMLDNIPMENFKIKDMKKGMQRGRIKPTINKTKKKKSVDTVGGKITVGDIKKPKKKKIIDTVGGISKSKKKPIRLKKPKEGKGDSSVIVDYTVIDELKSGGKVKGYKKGGPITYRMSGGQVVGNSYD